MNNNNLSTLNITEFNTTHTIYIRSKDSTSTAFYLCQFVSYDPNKRNVTGTIIVVEGRDYNNMIGKEITNNLSKCGLYGNSVEDDEWSHFHYFQADGYALNPMEEHKVIENALHCQKHPSYGLVSLTRHSGNSQTLFGSSITHSNTIVLRINNAKHHRSLNSDRYHAEEQIIEVEMSQTQFAELITTMNAGEGTPCTIRTVAGRPQATPPFKSKVEMFNEEFSNKMHNIGVDIEMASKNALDILQNKPTITKGDRELILKAVTSLMQNIKSNIPYVNKQFSEQMDKTITEAKGEIEAFIEHKIRKAGLEVLAESRNFPTVIELTQTIEQRKLSN
jgi:hypothetical protein